MVMAGGLIGPITSSESAYAEPTPGGLDPTLTATPDGTTGSAPTDSTDEDEEKSELDKCQSNLGGTAWLVCTVTGKTSEAVDWLYQAIEGLLVVNPAEAKDGTPIYEIWKYCRGVTNVVFIIFMLFVIYSQITGFGINNYGIKKVLPKLIVAAVLVNLSFLICQLGIEISNIVGTSLRGIFSSVEESVVASMNVDPEAMIEMRMSYAHLYNTLVAGSVVAIGAAVVSFESGAIWMLIPIILGAVVAVASGLITIALRQAVVALLVMIAPLAFVAMLFPNTEGLFKKWRKMLVQMLVFYPMFSLLFGASSLAGFAIMASAKDGFWLLLGAAVQVMPLFFSWSLMRMSGTMLGSINARMHALAARPLSASRSWADSRRQLSRSRRLASGRVYTPSLALMQYMSNRKIAKEAELEENKATIKNRGLAYRAMKNYEKDGSASREGAKNYEQQAENLRYLQIIERDKNNMNKGLGVLEAQPRSAILRARLARLDVENIRASDALKMEQARGEMIEYENARGFHKRMEDAINAHFDDKYQYTTKQLADGTTRRELNKEYRAHDIAERDEARARYNAASKIMEGNVSNVQYAAATAAQGYDTQKKIVETKMGKYFDLTPPTKDVEYRLGELTESKKAADNIDAIISGLRVLNQRGDTDLMRKQLENVLNSEGGVKLGTHASQALASFLMFEVKDNDPVMRRFGKYINLETAKVYNKNERQNDNLTLSEYFTGEYEDWEPLPPGSDPATTPKRMKPGHSKRPAATLLEGTSFDNVERTAYSNLDEMLINTYTKDGVLDVSKYLAKRNEIETAIGPAFISASLKYLSGSEQLKNAVTFLTGYDGDKARWQKENDPLYGSKEAEGYFRKKTIKYLKDQTPTQILGMRSDYKEALLEHLLSQYFEENKEEIPEFNEELAEIQTRYGELDLDEAKAKREEDTKNARTRRAAAQMRKILGQTGKLEQIYQTRRSGAANNAKDWLRGWINLDDEEAMYREVQRYKKGEKSSSIKFSEAAESATDENGRAYNRKRRAEIRNELEKVWNDNRDASVEEFYGVATGALKSWFGEHTDTYIGREFKKYYEDGVRDGGGLGAHDLKQKLEELLMEPDNYPDA